jgi:hypothetical protein
MEIFWRKSRLAKNARVYRREFRNIPLMEITPKEDRETTQSRVAQLLDGKLPEYHVQQRYLRWDRSIV